MRTKALILSAALVAAGVASSMAQSNVYSLNVVGYVNLTITTGYNLITLPLQSSDPTSAINSVLTNTSVLVPYPATVTQWNPTTDTFLQPCYAGGDGNWYDANFDPTLPTNSLPPGQGFFFYLPSVAVQQASGDPTPYVTSLTVTVVGTVLQGTNSEAIPAGYGFYGQFEPIVGDITTNGFPVTADYSELFTWNSSSQGYNPVLYGFTAADSGTAPYPAFYDENFNGIVVVEPPVGQGFVYFNAGTSASWTQNFTVQ
jgi:hypothetical protein